MTSSSAVPVGTTVTLNQVVEYAQQKFALAFTSLPPSPMIKNIPEAEATLYHQKMVQIGTTILRTSGKLRKPQCVAHTEQGTGKQDRKSHDERERDAVKTSTTSPASTAEGRLVPVWAKFTDTPHLQLDMYAEGRKKMLKNDEFPLIAYLPQFEVVRLRPNRQTAFRLRKSLVIYYLLAEGTLESFVEPKKCHFLLHLRRACIVHAKKKDQGLRVPMFGSGWQQHCDDLPTHNEMDQDMLEVERGIEALGLGVGNKCKRRRTSSDACPSRGSEEDKGSSIKQQPRSDQEDLKILLARTFAALMESNPEAALEMVRFSEEIFGRNLLEDLSPTRSSA